MQGLNKIFNELVWLTQLGFSMLIPPMLCLGLAWLAVEKLGAPLWIMVPAMILGLGSGAMSFYKFYLYTRKKAEKADSAAPPAFNNHT